MAQRPQAATNLRRLMRDVVTMANDAMEYAANIAEQEAKRTTAFRNYTGRLRASIAGGLIDRGAPQVIGVLTAGTDDANGGRTGWETPSREYSKFVELGTSSRPPHAFVHPTIVDIGQRNVLGFAVQQRFQRWRA